MTHSRRPSWFMLVALALLTCGTTTVHADHRFGQATVRPRTDGAIRVAAYNVLNLFDHVDDPALDGDAEDITMATSDERCRALAAAIRATDADVIALEEVESLACLTWFRDTYLKDLGYDHIASKDVGYWRGVECSVLSRFRITNVETWTETTLPAQRDGYGWSEIPEGEGENARYQRSPLLVDVQVNDDYALTLIVLHHKAGRTSGWKREGEALATTARVRAMLEENPDRNLIVLGDFNAAPWDKSFRLYLEAGLIDAHAHRIIPRSRDADQREADLFKTHESGRVLDYILLNSAAHREFVVGSAQVLGTLYDPEYDWRSDPFPAGYAADHYPVMIELIPDDRTR